MRTACADVGGARSRRSASTARSETESSAGGPPPRACSRRGARTRSLPSRSTAARLSAAWPRSRGLEPAAPRPLSIKSTSASRPPADEMARASAWVAAEPGGSSTVWRIGPQLRRGAAQLGQLGLHPHLTNGAVIQHGVGQPGNPDVDADAARRHRAVCRGHHVHRDDQRSDGSLRLRAADGDARLVEVSSGCPQLLEVDVGVADELGRARGADAHHVEEDVRVPVVVGAERPAERRGRAACALERYGVREVERAPRLPQPRLLRPERGGRHVEQVNLDPGRRDALLIGDARRQVEPQQPQREVRPALRHGAAAVAPDRPSAVDRLDGGGGCVGVCEPGPLERDGPGRRRVAQLDRDGEIAGRLQASVLQWQVGVQSLARQQPRERERAKAEEAGGVLFVLVEDSKAEYLLLQVLAQVGVEVEREPELLLEARVGPGGGGRLLLAKLEELEVDVGRGAQPVRAQPQGGGLQHGDHNLLVARAREHRREGERRHVGELLHEGRRRHVDPPAHAHLEDERAHRPGRGGRLAGPRRRRHGHELCILGHLAVRRLEELAERHVAPSHHLMRPEDGAGGKSGLDVGSGWRDGAGVPRPAASSGSARRPGIQRPKTG
eukprot:scaffold13039_cov101-Isochrysis_galbana.AAC.4